MNLWVRGPALEILAPDRVKGGVRIGPNVEMELAKLRTLNYSSIFTPSAGAARHARVPPWRPPLCRLKLKRMRMRWRASAADCATASNMARIVRGSD
eukprot:370208-Pleurochrysis_carterae.AAC.2